MGWFTENVRCTACSGTGKKDVTVNCSTCNRTGKVSKEIDCTHKIVPEHFYCTEHSLNNTTEYHN